jgi:hypothetical protein
MAITVVGSGLALLVLAMPQPTGVAMPMFPVHDFDLARIPAQIRPANLGESPKMSAIDATKDGIKGGQWDEMPSTRWTYQAGKYGPAIELGTGGGKLQPLRNNRPKQRDGKLAHLVVGWDF